MMISNELLDAYKLAVFKVYTEYKTIELRPQKLSKELSDLHAELNVNYSAVITAHNPFSEKTNIYKNELAQARLLTQVTKRWSILSAEGVDLKGQWESESSLLVLGIGLEEAVSIGKKYKQNAILFISKNGQCDLYDCNSGLLIT